MEAVFEPWQNEPDHFGMFPRRLALVWRQQVTAFCSSPAFHSRSSSSTSSRTGSTLFPRRPLHPPPNPDIDLMILLPLTLLFFSTSSSWNPISILPALAAQGNESCNVGDQRLQQGTYQFSSDCDAMWFCNSSNICDWKTCKRDDFPFGYWENVTIPDKCPPGFFCPDEQDSCQPLLAVGSPCQLNRDGAFFSLTVVGSFALSLPSCGNDARLIGRSC